MPVARFLPAGAVKKLFTSDITLFRGKPVKDWYIHAYRLHVILSLRPGELSSNILSPTRAVERLHQDTYRYYWRRYLDYNGINKKTPYELQHTFFSATKLIPPDLIKPVGRHSKRFDGQNYKHEQEGHAYNEALMINAVFKDMIK